MNYKDFGLDVNKRSSDQETVGKSWCLWCNRSVKSGMSLCFVNWVICKDCADTATLVENNHRWEIDECYTCREKNTIAIRTVTAVPYHLCKNCIDMAKRVLNNRKININEMIKEKKTTGGLGLSALLDSENDDQSIPKNQELSVDDIESSPLNPRKTFIEADLVELAASIKKTGLIQAITVRPTKPGSEKKFELVCGERRWRASKLAGLKTIYSSVRDLSDDEAMELMVTENLQRKDVHPMEEADAFHMMQDKMRYKMADIAAKVGKNEAFVNRRVQLRRLIPELQTIFREDNLSIGHAELLSRISPKDQNLWFTNVYLYQYDPGQKTIKHLRNYLSQNVERKLAQAPFDIKEIFTGDQYEASTCKNCLKNSSVYATLFPDQLEDAICNNSHCFTAKCNADFENKLVRAMEDPTTIFAGYNMDQVLVNRIKKEGFIIYKEYSDYREVTLPNITKWKGETDEMFNARKEGYEVEYKEKLAESTKAFCISGNSRGRYINIALTVKVEQDPEDILKANKIADIKKRRERGLELDAEKVMTKLVDAMKEKPNSITSAELSQHEQDCLVVMAYTKGGRSEDINIALGLGKNFYDHDNGAKLLEAIKGADQELRSKIIRRSLYNQHTAIHPKGVSGSVINYLADDWCPQTKAIFIEDQEAVKEKREKNLDLKLKEIKGGGVIPDGNPKKKKDTEPAILSAPGSEPEVSG